MAVGGHPFSSLLDRPTIKPRHSRPFYGGPLRLPKPGPDVVSLSLRTDGLKKKKQPQLTVAIVELRAGVPHETASL